MGIEEKVQNKRLRYFKEPRFCVLWNHFITLKSIT